MNKELTLLSIDALRLGTRSEMYRRNADLRKADKRGKTLPPRRVGRAGGWVALRVQVKTCRFQFGRVYCVNNDNRQCINPNSLKTKTKKDSDGRKIIFQR